MRTDRALARHRPRSRGPRTRVLLLGLLGGLSSSLAVEPERRSVRLVYELGPGVERCPSQEVVEQQVRSRLGYDPFAASATRSVRASIARSPRQLRARVELRDERGKTAGVRELDSPTTDCDELAASVAFAISLAIDPLSGSSPPPSASSSSPPPPSAFSPPSASSAPPLPSAPPVLPAPPSPPASSAPRADPPPPAASSSLAPLVYAGGFAALGSAPAAAAGLSLGAGARWTGVSLALEGRWQAPASTEGAPGQRVSASVLSLALVPCAHVGVLMACALGSIGSLRGEGQGVDEPRARRALVADVGGRIGVEAPLVAPLSLRLFGEAVAHLSSVSLDLNQRTVWSLPSLGGGGGLSFAAAFR